MRNVLEFDANSSIITNLGFDSEEMYKEADVLVNLELAEQLKRSSLDYYRQLMESKEQVLVRFSGFRERNRTHSDELFVIFDTVELVYPVERVVFEGVPDATLLLEKEYKVYISDVIQSENKVILADSKETTRKQAADLIREKLRRNEEIYLRGNILGLQKNGGDKRSSQMAAYVNIEGLGIIGIIPIKQWSVGFSATESFRDTIRNNTNAIVNFRVVGSTKIRYGGSSRTAFLCSRREFLSKIGYDPWKVVCQTLAVRSVVKVRIVEEGKSAESFFGAIDGIADFNMICYKDDRSDLALKDIEPGRYYYGYVQKMEAEKKFLRIRLTAHAEQGSELKMSVAQDAITQ